MGFKSKDYVVTGESLRQGTGGGSSIKPGWYVPKFNGSDDYVAILRFLPNMLDPTKQVMKKSITWLGDPNQPDGGRRKMAIDNPRTIGDWDNPISSLYSDLYNSGDERKKKLAGDCIGTTDKYYSFIQVISDPQQPTLNNQVMMMSFGKKIYDKIVSEADDVNPFDLCDAQMFKLVISKVHNQNNYDQSKFYTPRDITNGYRYTLDGVNWYVATPDTPDAEAIEDQLHALESAIDISDCKYTPWDAETRTLVEDRVQAVREAAYPELIGSRGGAVYGAPSVPGAYTSAPGAQNMFIPQVTSAPAQPQVQAQAAPVASAARPVATPVAAAPQQGRVPVAPVPAAPAATPTSRFSAAASPVAAPAVAGPSVNDEAEQEPVSSGFNTDELFEDI